LKLLEADFWFESLKLCFAHNFGMAPLLEKNSTKRTSIKREKYGSQTEGDPERSIPLQE
jgi:hypothetical protein